MVALFLYHYETALFIRETGFLKNSNFLNFSRTMIDIFSGLVADGTALQKADVSMYLDITKQSIDVFINKYKLMYLQNIDSYSNLKTELNGDIIKVWEYYFDLYYNCLDDLEFMSNLEKGVILEKTEVFEKVDTYFIEALADWKEKIMVMFMESMSRSEAAELLEPYFKDIDLELEQTLVETKGVIARSMDKISIDIIKVSKAYSIDNNKLLMSTKISDIHIDLLHKNHDIIERKANIFFEVSVEKINECIATYNSTYR
jgi:hypothetical protein